MRTWLFACALAAGTCVCAEPTVREGLKTPPPGYGEVPFWWWNGETLDKERLLWQIEELHQAGISGMQVNYCHYVSDGWKTAAHDPPVFSDAWWDVFSFVAVECAKRGMGVGLSGYTLDWPGRDNLFRQLGICAPETCGKVLVDEGHGQIGVRVNGESLDPFNPESAQRVIARFFEPFLRHVPPEAHKALNYFFQDELRLNGDLRLWGDDFAAEFKKRKGYDIVPRLPHLFGGAGPEVEKTRLDYNDVQVALTEERYFKPIYDWHAARGMIYACDPASRGRNPMEFGDYMRCMRWYTAPGFDTPGSGPDPVKCKMGSSIAHLYHRPRVWLEGYHSLGWQASTETIFAATARNYVYGANLLNLHGLYYTTFGGYWEWAPPCYHFRQPYWTLLPHTLKYFERLSWALTRGDHVCDVAIVTPQETCVMDRGRGRQAAGLSHQLVDKLAVHGTTDCDYIDSDSLAKATVGKDAYGPTLDVVGEHYRVVIVPQMKVMRETSRTKLAAFAQAGGRVIDAWTSEDVKLPLVAVPDVTGNPGLKVNHRRTADEDIYYLVDWDGQTDITFRVTGRLEILDLWTGEPTATPRAGEPVLAVIRRAAAGEPCVLRAVKETTTEVVRLPDIWEVELKPTMDNRWGDFRQPPSPAVIGPEVREMTWVEKNRRVPLSYGPQFLQDGTNVFSFSWQMGVWNQPQQQNRHHGLNMRIGDEFFVLGPYSAGWDGFYDVVPGRVGDKSTPTTYETYVFAPEALGATVVCTAEAAGEKIGSGRAKPWPTEILVDGKSVRTNAVVKLAKGYTPVKVSFNGFGRASLVFRRAGVALPKRDESKPRLAMRWYDDPGVLMFDPFAGRETRGTFTATVPPGTVDAVVDAWGEVVRKEIKDGVLTVEVAYAPGRIGAGAFKGPIQLVTKPAPMKLGDWAATEGLRCYSGGAVYRTSFDLAAKDLARTGARYALDLGRVGCAASVRVNGGAEHVVMCPPWTVEVTGDVKAGANAVEVTVYNTLNNHYQTIPTRYKRPVRDVPSGLLGPVVLKAKTK